MRQQQPPLRLILKQFNELTLEEEDLYYDAFCFYCGHKVDVDYDSHWCASKQAVKGRVDFN